MKLAWIFGFPPQEFLIAQMNFSQNENENKFKNYEFKDTFFHCAFFCIPAGNHSHMLLLLVRRPIQMGSPTIL